MHQDLDVVHVYLNVFGPLSLHRSMEIFISLLLSHQMNLGESNATPNSLRLSCNHTHCVAAFTAPLYSALAEEMDIVWCFLLDLLDFYH